MKRVIMIIFALLPFLSAEVYAELHDRGGGLIYDDVLNITWLQDANYAATELTEARVDQIISAVGSIDGHALTVTDFIKNEGDFTGLMSWWGAMAWVDQLEYGGYDDWRLPQSLPVDGLAYKYGFSYDGSTDHAKNISAPDSTYPGSMGSEMAYMHFNNLNNLADYDVNGNYIGNTQGGIGGLQNTGPFENLQAFLYRSGTKLANNDTQAWDFNFDEGYQDSSGINENQYAWAVRDGDVGMPEPQYSVTDLGPGIAQDINNNSQVVGTWYPDPSGGGPKSFYWDSISGRENTDLPGAFESINDSGEAVNSQGYIWNSTNGEIEEIPIFPRAINNSRIVTGWTGGGPGGGDLAVVWDDTNGIQPIAGGINGNGHDINDFGKVVGRIAADGQFNGFIWDNSNGLQNIPTLGGNNAEANALNNLGQVVGVSRISLTSIESHAFLWDEINGIEDLGTLGYRLVGSDDSVAFDVNINREVVGRSNSPSSTDNTTGWNGWVAFIRDNTNGMQDLNDLIAPNSGWILGTAFAINDHGQIVGYGGFNGVEHAFLLTPIHDSDGDGIPDDQDACPSSDLSVTVIIDGWDTGVQNALLEDGCTISDLISECAGEADSHGEFVSAVSHTTNALKKEGIISGKEKGKIQKCAAKADIP